jgi:hypothetical protein
MVEELLRQLPEAYAGLTDQHAVMHEADDVVAELHAEVLRLGEVIVGAGLPARAWRAPEADLRLLSGYLPAVTVDGLITRLAEFAAGLGPAWLHGDGAALGAFHAEVATLHDLMRSVGIAAQRMRVAPAHQRVVTVIEQVTLALSDLLVLAPFMRPLSAEEWGDAPLEPAADTGAVAEQEPILAPNPDEPAPGPCAQGDDITLRLADTTKPPAGDAPTIRLRDTATKPASVDGPTLRLRDYARTVSLAVARGVPLAVAPTERLDPRPAQVRQQSKRLAPSLAHSLVPWLEPLPRRFRALARSVRLPPRLAALLGLILLLTTSVLLLGQRYASQAQPVSTLVVSPTRLTLACAREAWAALTLNNPSTRPLTWQAQSPPTLTVSPAHGTLAAGRHFMLRVTVVSTHLSAGTITITAPLGKVAVPYAFACT